MIAKFLPGTTILLAFLMSFYYQDIVFVAAIGAALALCAPFYLHHFHKASQERREYRLSKNPDAAAKDRRAVIIGRWGMGLVALSYAMVLSVMLPIIRQYESLMILIFISALIVLFAGFALIGYCRSFRWPFDLR